MRSCRWPASHLPPPTTGTPAKAPMASMMASMVTSMVTSKPTTRPAEATVSKAASRRTTGTAEAMTMMMVMMMAKLTATAEYMWMVGTRAGAEALAMSVGLREAAAHYSRFLIRVEARGKKGLRLDLDSLKVFQGRMNVESR
ncbi:hypothetical protein BJX64DRAFT_165838 [Aspergillus heterothallicus]